MLRKAQVEYLARESFAGFRRRKLTTGVTILIMGSALLILALLTLVTLNLGHMLDTARQGIDIRVFLAEDVAPATHAELQPRLVTIPGVGWVRYITPEAALEEFRVQLGQEAELLDMLGDNPLPASFHLSLTREARNLEAVQRIRAEIGAWPEVAEVVYNQEWIHALESWSFRFKLASLVVGLLVFVSAVFVIANTVKLTLAASARVIEIQKLVGATNNFIRTPFLCEGMIQGALAGTLAMGLLGLAGWWLSDRLGGLVFFSSDQVVGFILLCVTLGLIGSFAAMRKYLGLQGGL